MNNDNEKVLTDNEKNKLNMLVDTLKKKKINIADVVFTMEMYNQKIAELQKTKMTLLNEIGQTNAVLVNSIKDCMKDHDINQSDIDQNKWGIDLDKMILVLNK